MKWILLILLLLTEFSWAERPVIRIGSKNFTESYILAEILAQSIEASGQAIVERKFGMGGTGILYEALRVGEIDVYPEYTGTLTYAILAKKSVVGYEALSRELAPNLRLSRPLGFNNSYGLALPRELSDKHGLTKISQLKDHKQFKYAFSYEFMERKDGYRAFSKHYQLQPSSPPIRMDHSLVYQSVGDRKTDIIEVYTTDPKIKKFDLTVLEDDLEFFPRYDAIYLYQSKLQDKFPQISELLAGLKDISDDEMMELNALVELDGKTFGEAASTYLKDQSTYVGERTYAQTLVRLTKRHLVLVALPVLVSALVGIPMGIAAAKYNFFGRFFLIFSGLFQTVPSLALLCFLIPVLGIGLVPAMVALFLYSLLPVVRSTYSGLVAIDTKYHEVAQAIGLNKVQKLFRIELPMATVAIIGGIQTSAVMAVGMATLAAFIGAGGYGTLIVTGLALNDNEIILRGALPAAAMAVFVHLFFEVIEKFLSPKNI